MKIAIFHNFMDNIGGAEIVALTFAREFDADIYSTNIDREKILKLGFKNIRIYSIGKVPINAPYRQQMALWHFLRLNLKSKYDLFIIAGDWAMSAAWRNKPNLWYIHSPIREIWDLYADTRKHTKPWLRYVFDVWVQFNRMLNRKFIQEVDLALCNSKNTQNRLKKYLNREAIISYPPIDTSKYTNNSSGDYWLSVNRLINHKRVDLQMKAFSKMPEHRLILVGCYEESKHFTAYTKYIESITPDNVTLLSWVDDQSLQKLYANCRGFITTAKDEDFGMTVVEAMASGKPVIAPNEGGYKESLLDGETGVLIDGVDPDKIVQAVRSIEAQGVESYQITCETQAQNFDTKLRVKQLKKLISNHPSFRENGVEW